MELKTPNISCKKDYFSVSNGDGLLELGLNLELSQHGGNHECCYSKFITSEYGFTFLQRQELEQQLFIYKYIEAGLPVPSHLIIPICKSIACSFKGLHDSIRQNCPNSMGYGSLCLDFKSGTEAEPRRCRRTDGKKWRCSKGVVQNHKYCEKHMHRGRHHTRKHVKPASSNMQLSSSTSKSISTTMELGQVHQISELDATSFSIALPIN